MSLGQVWASNDGLYMFSAQEPEREYYNNQGELIDDVVSRPKTGSKVWLYDRFSQSWGASWDSGIGPRITSEALIALDSKNEVGWAYGGTGEDQDNIRPQLIRFEMRAREKPIPQVLGTYDAPWARGEMVYVGGAGDEGVLVLIGGEILPNVDADPDSGWSWVRDPILP